MKIIRGILLVLVACLSFNAFNFPPADASSPYDDFFPTYRTLNLINHIENYYGNSCGSATDDYSYTWAEAMHINNVYSSDPAHGVAMASFDAALSGDGGWWVEYSQINNGNNFSNPYFITVYWADDASQWEQVFTPTSSSSPKMFKLQRKVGVPDTVKLHQGVVGSSQLIQGVGGCEVEWLWGGPGYDVNYAVITDTAPGTKLFISTFDVSYPEDYEGDPVPSEPIAPATSPYSGTIDCGGTSPQLMSIYQPGNWGAATLTAISPERAEWSYNLSSSPYSITVDCGGTLASSPGTVDPLVASGDWMCDVYGTEPHHCILS